MVRGSAVKVMRDPQLKSVPLTDAVAAPFEILNGTKARRRLPFHLIEAVAVGSDALLILAASLLTGIAYHLSVLDRVGPIETFLGIGALTAINFSAILAARGAYQPKSLASFRKQVQETTTVWLFVFLVLSAAAFSLKVSETYSRGATLAFFAVGLSGNHGLAADCCAAYRACARRGWFRGTKDYPARRKGSA